MQGDSSHGLPNLNSTSRELAHQRSVALGSSSMAASRCRHRHRGDLACATWELPGQGIHRPDQLAGGDGDLPDCRGRTRQRATVDEVSDFAVGILGGERFASLRDIAGQTYLPEPWGHKGMTPALAFNT